MARPKIIQTFAPLGGDQEGESIIAMSDVFSSADSQNVWMDKKGRVRKSLGYGKNGVVSASAYTTDTGGSATRCAALFGYHAGTQNNFVLAVFDDEVNELEIATGQYDPVAPGNVTFRKDMGAPNSNGNEFDFCILGDERFLCISGENPQIITGTSTVADAGGTQSPTPSASGTGTGPLKGTYEWKLVSVESDGSRHAGSNASTELQVGTAAGVGENVALTWTADSDTNVVGYELYRTTGDGKAFYFVSYIDVRTTASFTDTFSDDEIRNNRGLVSHGEAPPSGAFWCEAWLQRVWYGKTLANPLRVWWSDVDDGDSCDLTRNFVDIGKHSTSEVEVTGLKEFRGSLYASTRSGIWRISGSGSLGVSGIPDFRLEKTNAISGWVRRAAVAELPAGAVLTLPDGSTARTDREYLVYVSNAGDVRVFDGQNETMISKPKEDFSITFATAQNNHILHDSVNSQIFIFQRSTETGLIYNYQFGVWSEMTDVPFACSLELPPTPLAEFDSSIVGPFAHVMLTGEENTATGGLIYTWWVGNNRDGVGNNIDSQFWTKPLHGRTENGGPMLSKTKRFREVDIVTKATSSSQNLTVEWFSGYADSGASAQGSATMDMTGTNVSHVQDQIQLKSTGGDYMDEEAVRLKFSDNADDEDWAIEGFTLSYQELEGVRER